MLFDDQFWLRYFDTTTEAAGYAAFADWWPEMCWIPGMTCIDSCIHTYIYMIHIREVADPYSHVTNMWQRFKYRTPRCDYWWNTRPTPQGKSQENILCTGSYPTTILR